LLFLVVVAILLPAVFDLTERVAARGMNISPIDERLSLDVSMVLPLLYAANLIYTLVTHRDVLAGDAPSGEAEWSIARALVVMVAATAVMAIQAALVVAPVVVLASWLIGQPMNLVFSSPLDLFAIADAAFIVRSVAADGETTWFEGLLLIGVYLLFALAYFFVSPG
jgi:Ca2+/H+ antiporter